MSRSYVPRQAYVPPRPTPTPGPVTPQVAEEIADLLEMLAAGLRSGQVDQAAVKVSARQTWPTGGVPKEPVVRVAVTVPDEVFDQASKVSTD